MAALSRTPARRGGGFVSQSRIRRFSDRPHFQSASQRVRVVFGLDNAHERRSVRDGALCAELDSHQIDCRTVRFEFIAKQRDLSNGARMTKQSLFSFFLSGELFFFASVDNCDSLERRWRAAFKQTKEKVISRSLIVDISFFSAANFFEKLANAID